MKKQSHGADRPECSGRNCSMMYSMTCAYALRAMCRLAAIEHEGYVNMHEICEGTDLPEHFIAKIFRDLARADLLSSAKGRHGGFALTRSASEISLYDIIEVIDGTEQYNGCVVGLADCDDKQPCPQHEYVKPVRRQILNYLKSTKLDEMGVALHEKERLIGRMQRVNDRAV